MKSILNWKKNIYVFEYFKLETNDKSGIWTLVNLIRLHFCCLNSHLIVTAKADAC